MKLGIISDTHGILHESIYEVFDSVDFIIHAGDIGRPSVLWELDTIAPTIAVKGNNDWDEYGSYVKKEAKTIIGGVNIYVTHFPHEATMAAKSGEYGLVIHGHTHERKDDLLRSCRIINPGSASRPRDGQGKSAAILTLNDGVVGPVQFIQL